MDKHKGYLDYQDIHNFFKWKLGEKFITPAELLKGKYMLRNYTGKVKKELP